MLKNHLTIAFRNLSRKILVTWINIGGLGLGLACQYSDGIAYKT